MAIPEDLKKHIRNGDLTLIKDMYAEKHDHERTVSIEYVRLVIEGKRDAKPGTAAEEILDITQKYLEHRQYFIDELLTESLDDN